LFNFYIVKDNIFKEWVEQFPKVDEIDPVGINFVNLLKHEDFYFYYQKADQSKMKFYQGLFNEYIFKGKNLYSYWTHENNPLFLLTFSVANGLVNENSTVT
jgi:hypothetical protein